MNENNVIVVEYVCECGNKQLVNNHTTHRDYNSCVQVYDCKTICLTCGKNMKLQVSKENHKTEVEIIEETL